MPKGATSVLMDVRTGEVVSVVVSLPEFRPQQTAPEIDPRQQDPSDSPLFNRVGSGRL